MEFHWQVSGFSIILVWNGLRLIGAKISAIYRFFPFQKPVVKYFANDILFDRSCVIEDFAEAYDRLLDRMSSCAERIFGEEVVGVAMDEFLLWPDPDEEIAEGFVDQVDFMFWPWFLFNWEYDPLEAGLELSAPEGRTVAELYAEDRGNRLDPMERCLIGHINRKPYSFLEVMRVDEGQGVQVKDILKGNRIDVQEKTGSEYLQTRDLLFGRAVSVEGVGRLFESIEAAAVTQTSSLRDTGWTGQKKRSLKRGTDYYVFQNQT